MRLCALQLLVACTVLGQAPEFDIIITGGRVIDGSGNSWQIADIGIRGDTIAAIGLLAAGRAQLRLDASGLVVAPGFIDTHSHGRGGIFEVPSAENLIHQGVTTIIEGPDGNSPIVLGPFLERLGKSPATVNVGSMAGHGSIRRAVLGTANRKGTPGEIAKMKELMQQAMLDGAFGISTGLFYVPGNFAPFEELIELAKIAGAMGGIHTSHIRDEARGVIEAVCETIRIGEHAGLPTHVSHHKILGRPNWGKSADTIRLVEEARTRGVDITLDQNPYTAAGTWTAAMFPQWSLEGGNQALIERLAAPETRTRIKMAIAETIVTDRGGGDPKNVVMASCSFDPSLDGMSLTEITRARGLVATVENAAETVMDIQKKGGCFAIYHAMAEPDVERIMRYPFTMIASDGGIPVFGQALPHPRSYGAFARVLGHYVRERKILTLEDAVRRMTSLPASRFKLFDRGLIRPGMKADVVVFDPATVADRADFVNPHQYSAGCRHVLVNGTPVLVDGRMRHYRPGRVLYGPAYKR